jgi:DUF177 domain-containing protein
MKISIDEIPQSPKEIKFSERLEELNELYRRTNNRDFFFPPSLEVNLVYYRSGQDIFFSGAFHGRLRGRCSRCIEDYSFTLDKRFEFVLTPDPTKADRGAEELHRDDLGLSYYSSEEIDLEPLIAEQVMLALPTRPLCSDNCRGLCSHCGANLNKESCACAATGSDSRMAIFRSLKVGR